MKYYNLTLISTHAPTEEKSEVAKEEFYSSCDAVPNDNMEIVLGDLNTKVGKESYLYPACGGLLNETNGNGKWMINFAMGRDLAVTETWYQHKDIPRVDWKWFDKICNQLDYILVGWRHLWCEKYERSWYRIRTFLVRAKIRLKIKRNEKIKKSEIKKNGILVS